MAPRCIYYNLSCLTIALCLSNSFLFTDDEWKPRPHIIPVPVPIYVPVPMALYNYPTPYPLPIPIPIPVPCFIPTTKKSAPSILKHMKVCG